MSAHSRTASINMSPKAKILAGLAYLALGIASGLAATTNDHSAILHSSPPKLCLSSPLLSLQSPLYTPQCKPPSGNATSHPPTNSPSPDEASSGGWSGPHACAGSYCVYSNPSFAAGRGIAIISDGESANALANLPVFIELAGPQAAALLPQANINTKSPSVETSIIPHKGRGFTTTAPLHRGAQLLAYTAALIIRRSFVDDLSRAEQLRLLRDAVHRLPAQTRAAFWQQLGQTHEDDDDDILDIVTNNSFNLPLSVVAAGGAAAFIGNFPEVSMYNHDCRPNVAFHLAGGGLVHRTHAVRAVAGGEELAISYVDSYRVREVRRARTRRNWGFECACAQCVLAPALVNASDHRLWRMWEVENSLWMSEAAEVKQVEDVVDRVELLLSLYQQERLIDSHGAVAYKTAALGYNSVGKGTLAVKYALLALEAFIVEEGASASGVRDMLALLDDPEGHWSWRKRA